MFCNKENVNLLTALLVEYGVTDAVVCPGSRNAPIVHNLNECDRIACRPVTDERSAGFYALGMAQATHRPVVVCVTSGSALLNVMPAVAEAYYQHVPLIVVSADRPAQWIDQLDGQTLPQPDALGRFVRRAVQLPEPHNDEERWYCRRLVNEALFLATCRQPAPVHINVPITEPLFTFDVEALPNVERWTMMMEERCLPYACEAFTARIAKAERPLIVIGQMPAGVFDGLKLERLMERYVVFAEPLSNTSGTNVHFDEAVKRISGMSVEDAHSYRPDYIVYLGNTIVSKATRRWLRSIGAPSCLVTPNALEPHDPLMTLTDIVECTYGDVSNLLNALTATPAKDERGFYERWKLLLDECADRAAEYEPEFSQMAVVRYFEEQLDDLDMDIFVHYANSSAIRLACIYANHYVWCNRGVNGIEGSLSTAAGFSLASTGLAVCVIGDLSFLYDQNALWNRNLNGSLRILLLNNRTGGIFRSLPGLKDSPAADDMVAATHETTAQGICTQNDIGYLSAKNMQEAQIGIVTLLTRQTDRPLLLEVFTEAEADAKATFDFYIAE